MILAPDDKLRSAIIAEAHQWLRTPYHHMGRVKGAGVDCAQLLIAVYHACGLIPEIDPGNYPSDWHLHRSTERYLFWVEKYAERVENPLPGDIALFKFGRCMSHGAIIIGWPDMIHSYKNEGCCLVDASKGKLADREHVFYSVRVE